MFVMLASHGVRFWCSLFDCAHAADCGWSAAELSSPIGGGAGVSTSVDVASCTAVLYV